MPTNELTASLPFAQASLALKGTLLEATLIEAGPSRNGTYYPIATLQEAASRFAGVRCFCDHGAMDQSADSNGRRSVADLAGRVEEAWFEGDRIRGRIRLSSTQDRLAILLMEGIAGDLSITAVGATKLAKHEGRLFRVVEAIHRPLSVDFVTEAAAGGRVERILQEQVDREQELLQVEWELAHARAATFAVLLGR